MRLNLPTLALIGAFAFLPSFLTATSIVPFANLGEATIFSECVVLAHAVESIETNESGSIYKDMRFEILETVKGNLLPGNQFVYRPFSRSNATHKLEISGDFKPETGKTYLLFLYQKGSFYQPIMLSYYVFEQIQSGDKEYLTPIGGAGMDIVARPDGVTAEPLVTCHKSLLIQSLQAYAGTSIPSWNGTVGQVSLTEAAQVASDRAVPVGCDFTLGGPNLCRWENPALPIYYDDNDNPAGWLGTFANILSALSDNYTGTTPSNAGPADFDPDCADGAIGFNSNFIDFCESDLNGSQSALIIFEDPCNEIPNLNNCIGTLAFGGSYSSTDTHLFDGVNWDNAVYGFVVVNNGTPGCLNALQFEQMLTHELTHVYRMGHLNASNFPNQNMNPFCCNAINHKDRECMDYAYPPPAPVELTSFEVRLKGEKEVQLQWVTESEKENDYFTIFRSSDGIQYEPIQKVPSKGSQIGGNYTWVDQQPLSGINYYLLSQTDFDGTTQHLGVKTVRVAGQQNQLIVQPNPVQDNKIGVSIELQHYFEGKLEVLNTDGKIISSQTVSLEQGPQRIQHNLGELPAGLYLLRMYNGQQNWAARFTKQ